MWIDDDVGVDFVRFFVIFFMSVGFLFVRISVIICLKGGRWYDLWLVIFVVKKVLWFCLVMVVSMGWLGWCVCKNVVLGRFLCFVCFVIWVSSWNVCFVVCKFFFVKLRLVLMILMVVSLGKW